MEGSFNIKRNTEDVIVPAPSYIRMEYSTHVSLYEGDEIILGNSTYAVMNCEIKRLPPTVGCCGEIVDNYSVVVHLGLIE